MIILNFEFFKFWTDHKKTRGAITYASFLESLRTDAAYHTQVYQFIANNRRQHVKERVCLSPCNRTN